MSITKDGNGVLVETPVDDKDQWERSGTIRTDEFALCEHNDRLKQIDFDASAQQTNTTTTIKSGATSGDVVITLPATSGTLTLVGGLTEGAIPFGDATGQLAVDAAHLKWDDTNNRLSVGSDASVNTIVIGGVSYGSTLSVNAEGATDLVEQGLHRHSDIASLGAHKVMIRSRGTDSAQTVVQSGDTLSRINTAGFDGTDYALAAEIAVEVDGTPGANDMPGRVVFKVTPDGSQTPVEAMRISSTGVTTLANALPATSGGTGTATYATGDTLYASAANTLSKRTIGTSQQVYVADPTGVPDWNDPETLAYKGAWRTEDFTEYFVSGTGGFSAGGFHPQSSGAASVSALTTTNESAAHQGILEMGTGTATNGVSWIDDGIASTKHRYFGGGSYVYETIVRVSALSDGTDTYALTLGFQTGTGVATATDGAYFSYISSANSGNWIGYTSASSSNTALNTSTPPSTSAWQRLKIVVNDAGTSVSFYINDVLQGSNTTNIPASSVPLRMVSIIGKTAGTTSRSAYLDAIRVGLVYSASR